MTYARSTTKSVAHAGSGLLSLAISLIVSMATTGCSKSASTPAPPATPPAKELKAAPATPIEEKKEELGGKTWDPQWDLVVEKALPPEMLSRKAAHAVAGFCPRFAAEAPADKRAFWAYLFQALAGAEAGLDPTTTVRHTEAVMLKTDKVTKLPIRQEDLLQLAYEDAKNYGCDFDFERDRRLPVKDPNRTILQPANNLGCGIRIMQNQIITQGKPMIAKTSYWSTLQPGTMSYRVFQKQMANVPAACGVGALKPRRHAPETP